MIDVLRLDLRQALRVLAQRPTTTLVVVAVLGIGIAANVVAFGLIHGILIEPLPFPDSDELTVLWEHNVPRGRDRNVVNPANFLDWREQGDLFERMAAFVSVGVNVAGEDLPALRARAGLVTEGFFETLGTAPLEGRTFVEEEHLPESGQPAVVLSHAFWQGTFGGGDVVGRSLRIDGADYEVVGIMPSEFAIDLGPSVAPFGSQPDFWTPLPITDAWERRSGRWLMVVGRRAPGVSLEQAQAAMAALGDRLAAEYPSFNGGWTVNVVPLHDQIVREVRPALTLLGVAVVLVLLVACGNVASLLVARALARSNEMAVRSALGATRGRLARQLVVESAVLGTLALGVGLWLAALGGRAVLAIWPGSLPRAAELGQSPLLLLFALGLSALTVLLVGLAPALWVIRSPAHLLRAATSGGGRGGGRLRTALVGAEIALAAILLLGAGLLVRSFDRLQSVDPGFERSGALAFSLALPRDTDPERRRDLYSRLLDELAALPGVTGTGAVTALPLDGLASATSFRAGDREPPPPEDTPTADVRFVAGDYFRTLGIPLLEGRPFDSRDAVESERRPVIVSEALARELWPDDSAVGREIEVSWGDWIPSEIVGVVRDVRLLSLDSEPRPALYWPHALEPSGEMSLVVATDVDPLSLADPVRATVAEAAPELPLYDLRPIESLLRGQVEEERFVSRALGAFAATALLLAALGLYGVMTLLIGQRTREIGVRVALGASPQDIRRMVLGRVALITAVSLAVGLGGGLLLTRLLRSQLFGVVWWGPVTLLIVAAVLAAAALAAGALPAFRAARLAPVRALREE